jgi:uncharacterized protein with FMN-binding domain
MSPDPSRSPLWDPLVDRSSTVPRRLPPPAPGTAPPPSRPLADRELPRPGTGKRKRPARGARAGALVLSCAATGALTYWFAGTADTQAATEAIAALPAPLATSTATTSSTSATTTGSATAATTPSTSASTSTGAVTEPAATVQAFDGSVVQTRYGPVQVQVQITGGAISDVAVIQYPDGDGKSVRINARALPTLRTEVLTAQSADVDTVSGATYTSDAYVSSLQSAIDEARAAGATEIA